MDKKYQVFISSTYEDLQDERREVMQALLELECIPSGMELFPASSEDQWSLIQNVIDDCDYYILIIGGRYGSTDKEGMSYTEKEYRYAIKAGKPSIAFLPQNSERIPNGKSESTKEGRKKLEEFKKLAEKQMVKFYDNPDDLGSKVSRSMVKLIKRFPAIGWIKADSATDEKSVKEIIRLQNENEDLRKRLAETTTQPPVGTEHLSQGEDQISLNLQFLGEKSNYSDSAEYVKCILSWNKLFSVISPHLINECDEESMDDFLIQFLKDDYYTELIKIKENRKYRRLHDFYISDQEFQIIKVQFKALGLIEKSQKNQSVKDHRNFWTLTRYGDYIMTKLLALRNNNEDKKKV